MYGVVTQGQGPAKAAGDGGFTSNISKRSARTRKPTAKLKEALAHAPASKKKQTVILTDDEDEVPPQKRKRKPRVVEGNPDSDEDSINHERPRKQKTRVFSQASSDAADTRANTEASSDLDDLEYLSTEPADATEAKGDSSDELEYSQMDEMANKDARVSDNPYPGLLRLTSGCV